MTIHTRHCCIKHGCKYGDKDCPVESGFDKQEIPCESCSWDAEERGDIARIPLSTMDRLSILRKFYEGTELGDAASSMIDAAWTLYGIASQDMADRILDEVSLLIKEYIENTEDWYEYKQINDDVYKYIMGKDKFFKTEEEFYK